MMPFCDIHISQGSVATCLKRGGIFKHEFVANFLQSLIVKKIWKWIIIGEVIAKSLVSCFFDLRCSSSHSTGSLVVVVAIAVVAAAVAVVVVGWVWVVVVAVVVIELLWLLLFVVVYVPVVARSRVLSQSQCSASWSQTSKPPHQ